MPNTPPLEGGHVSQKQAGAGTRICTSRSASVIGPALSTLARPAHRPWPSETSSLPLARPQYTVSLQRFPAPQGRGLPGWRGNSFSSKISAGKHLLLVCLTFCLVLSGIVKDGVYLQCLGTSWFSGQFASDYVLEEETTFNLTKFSTSGHSAWPVAINEQMPSSTQTVCYDASLLLSKSPLPTTSLFLSYPGIQREHVLKNTPLHGPRILST